MSEATAPATAPIEEPLDAGGNPLRKKLKVAGIISAIVVIQCFAVYLWLPSGAESTANASSPSEHAAHEPAHEHAPEQTEVDLGAFSLTVFNPNTNSNLLVDFHLYGTVTGSSGGSPAAEGGHGHGHGAEPEPVLDGDAAKLDRILKGHKHRFRDQVIVIVRNAQITDLADPGLGLLKRQILTKTNALLGEPLVKEVIFSDFVVVEQ